APRLQVLRVADPRVEKNVRRVIRAAAQDYLLGGAEPTDALAPSNLDADRALAFEQDAPRERLAHDLEVRTRHRGPEIRARRRDPLPVPDRALTVAVAMR